MPRFYLEPGGKLVAGTSVFLSPEDSRHAALSLRAASGDEVTVSDGCGLDARGVFGVITPDRAEIRILDVYSGENEPPFPIYLYMAYPKGDKMETVIQKAVELGAASVTPFFSSRCIRRPDGEKNDRLAARYEKIAHEAAGQCGRSRLPKIGMPLSCRDAFAAAAEAEVPLFCYEGAGTEPLPAVLSRFPHPSSVSVIVGSEGGFSPEEAEAAKAAGCLPTGLGKRILRCETAPLFALSCLLFHYDL